MEEQYSQEPEESQDEQVELYSKWAIRLFSLFFSPIVGGVLLMINLAKAGYKQAAGIVLAFAVGYTFILASILGSLGIGAGLTPLLTNFMGGLILSDYFYAKYFPEDDYYPRPIWGALGAVLLMNLTLFLILYYTGNLPPDLLKMMPKK